MTVNGERLRAILSPIGLMWGKNFINYPESYFTKYVSSEYKNSQRHETDEAYRMFELTLLHQPTGLRIVYTTSESYDGESVDYKVIDLFIITQDNTHKAVEDVDFDEQVIVTPDGTISFSETSKHVEPHELADPRKVDSADSNESFIDRIRKSPHRKFLAKATLDFLQGQNRRWGSKTAKIEQLKNLIAEIEAEEGLHEGSET